MLKKLYNEEKDYHNPPIKEKKWNETTESIMEQWEHLEELEANPSTSIHHKKKRQAYEDSLYGRQQ